MDRYTKISEFLRNICEKVVLLSANKRIKISAMIIIFLLMAVFMFNLNRLTPWVVDDILKGDGVRNVHSFSQYIDHIKEFYFTWGGRIWGELFAYLFLSIPKRVFDIINTIGYLVFVSLIYINITGKAKASPSLFLLINFLLFVCLPAFGQDILWISGTANYMWSSIIPLAYMAFWRVYIDKEHPVLNTIPCVLILFVLAVLSGWSNENVSVSLLFLAVSYMWLYHKKYGSVPLFSKTGLLGLMTGTSFLWLAPGNFVRFAAEKHSKSILHMLGNIPHNITALFHFNSTMLLLVIFVLFMLLRKNPRKQLAIILMLAGILASASMSVVGSIESRVFLGSAVLMIISVGLLYDDWRDTLDIRKCRVALLIILLIGMQGFYSEARVAIRDYGIAWNQNLEIIKAEKAKGNLDVYVNPITAKNKFCATYGLDDIQPQEKNQHWLNKGVAKAYGLNTIQSIHVSPDTSK